jgi:hypothetical protein
MVVDDFDIRRSSVRPPEADPPLIIDADAVLAEAIALECLQSVASRRSHRILRTAAS